MKKYFRLPSPAMLVAMTALVFSMAGTSYAVKQINGKTIKNKTITGKKLKSNTLTGSQIKESKLGKVRSSSNADNAANAAALEGTPAAGFARTANFVRVLASAQVGDPDVTLLTHGDISVKMRCYNSGGSDRLSVFASVANNGALMVSQEDSPDPLDSTTAFDSSEFWSQSTTENTLGTDDGYDETGWVLNAASDKLVTLLEGSSVGVLNRGGKDCTYGGVYILN